MNFNENKLARQKLSVYKYKQIPKLEDGSRRGILEGCTGFGKTLVAILRALEIINKESPESLINVVVPRTDLKDDWYKKGGHIETHDLKNVNVYVVNSYVNFITTNPDYLICNYLILDECHRYAREESEHFSTVVDITTFDECMALSATLNDGERRFLAKKGFTIFDTITAEEAEREGWIPPSVVFNLGIELSEEDREVYDKINDRFNYYFARFEHNFALVQACRSAKHLVFTVKELRDIVSETKTAEQWVWWWAQSNGWKGEEQSEFHPKKIVEDARLFGVAMDERKRFLYDAQSKIQACLQIEKGFRGKRIMFFSESSRFADSLAQRIGHDARPYHSGVPTELRNNVGKVVAKAEKVKSGKSYTIFFRGNSGKLWTLDQVKSVIPDVKKISSNTVLKETMSLFEKGAIGSICTVKKLDEGTNVEVLEVVVIASYTSASRQSTQREGRGKRIDVENPNKRAIIIYLYIKGTQEEKAWLKKAQSQTRRIFKVNSVEEIFRTLDNLVIVKQEPKLLFDNSSIA